MLLLEAGSLYQPSPRLRTVETWSRRRYRRIVHVAARHRYVSEPGESPRESSWHTASVCIKKVSSIGLLRSMLWSVLNLSRIPWKIRRRTRPRNAAVPDNSLASRPHLVRYRDSCRTSQVTHVPEISLLQLWDESTRGDARTPRSPLALNILRRKPSTENDRHTPFWQLHIHP